VLAPASGCLQSPAEPGKSISRCSSNPVARFYVTKPTARIGRLRSPLQSCGSPGGRRNFATKPPELLAPLLGDLTVRDPQRGLGAAFRRRYSREILGTQSPADADSRSALSDLGIRVT
jgi:hypothetical protein